MCSELDGAARRAMALYRELSATASAASLSSARLSMGPPSDMSARMGPVEEVLGSYRCSFAGLSSAVHTLATELQVRTLRPWHRAFWNMIIYIYIYIEREMYLCLLFRIFLNLHSSYASRATPSSHRLTYKSYLWCHVQDDELRCSFAASQPAPLPGRFPSTSDALRSSTGGGGSGSGNPFAHVLQTSAPGTLDGPPSSSMGPMGPREAFPQDGAWVAPANMGQGGKKPTSAEAAAGPPAELLEKYSDLLMKLVERKVDDMLLSKSQTRL